MEPVSYGTRGVKANHRGEDDDDDDGDDGMRDTYGMNGVAVNEWMTLQKDEDTDVKSSDGGSVG